MNVLITGGAGMIGSHCAEFFARQGHKVIVYDNLMRSKIFSSEIKSVEYNWHFLHQFKNIIFIKKDVRDFTNLLKTCRDYRPDVLIHAAGQTGIRFSVDHPLEDFEINTQGTFNALESLRLCNPKGVFIYCSTNKVYGNRINQYHLTKLKERYGFKDIQGVAEGEGVDLAGHTPYGISKLAGDLYVQDYAYTFGIKTAVFRMSCIYGTRQFGFEDQGWLAWFAIRCLQRKPVTLYGDGCQVRDVLWVSDLIDAFNKFIKSPYKNAVYNIGGGRENTLSLLELIKYLEEMTGITIPFKRKGWRPFDQKIYVSDITKVKRQLKWSPQIRVPQGLSFLTKWIKENPKLFNLYS